MTELELELAACQIRKKILKLHYEAQSGHIGSALSCVEILTYLFGQGLIKDPHSFILSKGHAASALYVTLNHFGLMPDYVLNLYYKDGGLGPHPTSSQYIPIATGSLGHGLPIACGIAYFRKIKKDPNRVYCLISDGEMDEGSTHEALGFVDEFSLTNLTVIMDYNGLQGFKETHMAPITWKDIDGHNFYDLDRIGKSNINIVEFITAQTVKGKGIASLENKLESHYLPLTQEQYEQAMKELE